jgi:hypothetical protein
VLDIEHLRTSQRDAQRVPSDPGHIELFLEESLKVLALKQISLTRNANARSAASLQEAFASKSPSP